MAGALIKIDEEIVTSAVASVTLTGIDSTYDVYMVSVAGLESDTDIVDVNLRFTVSGSADTSANYDYAGKILRTSTTFFNNSATNQTEIDLAQLGNATGEQFNCTLYCFNFNNSSEYSFITKEPITINAQPDLRGNTGGGVLTETQITDGVFFFLSSGNIDNGTFTLYGLKK